MPSARFSNFKYSLLPVGWYTNYCVLRRSANRYVERVFCLVLPCLVLPCLVLIASPGPWPGPFFHALGRRSNAGRNVSKTLISLHCLSPSGLPRQRVWCGGVVPLGPLFKLCYDAAMKDSGKKLRGTSAAIAWRTHTHLHGVRSRYGVQRNCVSKPVRGRTPKALPMWPNTKKSTNFSWAKQRENIEGAASRHLD